MEEENPSLTNDSLSEILSWLPDKSLSRFKSVSKTWQNLISQQTPVGERRPGLIGLNHPGGKDTNKTSISIFAHLHDEVRELPDISFTVPHNLVFLQSCNGLLLLRSKDTARSFYPVQVLFVCNPFKSQLVAVERTVDLLDVEWDVAGLAFDGLSKHYKVAIVHQQSLRLRSIILSIYDSATHKWSTTTIRRPMSPSPLHLSTSNTTSIPTLYSRNSLYWALEKDYMLILNIKSKKLRVVPLPVKGSKLIKQLWACNGQVYGVVMPAKVSTEKGVAYTVWAFMEETGRWEFWRRINTMETTLGRPLALSHEHQLLYVNVEEQVVAYDLDGKTRDVGRLKHVRGFYDVHPFISMFEMSCSIAT